MSTRSSAELSRERPSLGILFGLLSLILVLGLFVYFEGGFNIFKDLEHRFFPCQSPITYSINSFDQRFGISETQFLNAVAAAEALWEGAVGLDLFKPVQEGELALNLIYDYRQAGTEKLNELNANITSKSSDYDALKAEYDRVFVLYETQKTELDVMLTAHEADSQAYATKVEASNAEGGASPREYRALEEDRRSLNESAAAINAKVASINATADAVNVLADSLNELADHLNLTADRYNTIGDTLGDEFIEGTFGASSQGNEINIYQFEDQTKLIRVLTHELGHALGLGHVEDPEAVMYYLNESDNGELARADIDALKELCKIN